MKKVISLLLFFAGLSASLFAQHVGIGTENPQAMLDINGDVVFRTSDLDVADSVTLALDVNTEKFSCYRITGADSAFVLAGIMAGMDGRVITLINESGFPMELNHEDSTAAPEDQIVTGNHEDLVLDDMGMVTLQYDTAAQKWLVNSSNQVAQESVWDTSGTNIFFENYVGIGTDEPTTPLSIQTEMNQDGFSHTAINGEDSIRLTSEITDIGASIGTSSDDVFSLNAGGAGKVHILPDGDVVIGEDSTIQNLVGAHQTRTNDFDSKLTVFTPLNETGFTHIGGDNEIVVKEAIGGVSASIGTMSNHTFRLNAGGEGRLTIWPTGQVIIGNNVQPADGQLTVYTPESSVGYSQIGEGGQILRTHIGVSSASIGTWSNHNFRLTCNGASALSIWSPSLNVGIGTDFPEDKLTVYTEDNNFGFSQRSAGGIKLASHIGVVSASFGTTTNNKFRLVANNTTVMTIHPNGNVGIGMDDPINKLEVNGTIRSKEIIVETVNWPDYVFSNDYSSLSLRQLEEYIDQHHHLPNIPSANELEGKGIPVGEMQKKMMEKIEELTLYIIGQEKRIESLEQQLKNK